MARHTPSSVSLGRALTLVLSTLTFSYAGLAAAATPENADNTRVNQRDADARTLTPLDQSNTAADTETVAGIRAALMDDKSLSTSARNVKVIVRDGVATLRGPVASAEEKTRVQALARGTAGVRSVNNELDVGN